jgi:hypothetical protein
MSLNLTSRFTPSTLGIGLIYFLQQQNFLNISKESTTQGLKFFNHLPQSIKNLSRNVKKFKLALKKFLLLGSFYTFDEYVYLDWNSLSDLGTLI